MVESAKVYVHAAAALAPPSVDEHGPLRVDTDTDLRALTKRVLGQGLRQGSHFVELAAIGARQCLDRLGRAPASDMAVYFATALGELRKTESLFRQVLPPGPGMASPFDFINATANMASFYVARLASVSARNLTITQGAMSFESALQLAIDDLRAGAVPTALVGGVDENIFPRAEYVRRWPLRDDEIMGEGSAWLYLTSEAAGAIAELLSVRLLAPAAQPSLAWAGAVAEVLAVASGPVTLMCGSGVSETEREALASVLPSAQWQSYVEYCGSYPTASAFGLVSGLRPSTPGAWAHINRDVDGGTALMTWRVLNRGA